MLYSKDNLSSLPPTTQFVSQRFSHCSQKTQQVKLTIDGMQTDFCDAARAHAGSVSSVVQVSSLEGTEEQSPAAPGCHRPPFTGPGGAGTHLSRRRRRAEPHLAR